MENLRVLNSKDMKQIFAVLNDQYGNDYSILIKKYAFLMNAKNKVFMINRDFSKLDTSKVRINSAGMYLGEMYNGQMRCSIEGSAILGKNATKNVIEIGKDNLLNWLRGNKIEVVHEDTGFVIVKAGDDFAGAGKVKDNVLMPYVNKNRWVNSTS